MRVIITGGTGLIGRALGESLAAEKHEVIALSRNPQQARSMPKGVKVQQWDARTAAGWGGMADGADVIVNLAGASIGGENTLSILFRRWTNRNKKRILESRLSAGRAVVQAIEAARQKPKVLVQASAIGYYGVLHDGPVTEDSPRGHDFQARVPWDWEMSTSQAEVLGVRRVVIRSGLVMSRKAAILSMVMLPFKFFAGGRLGSGRQWFPWIHVDDEIGAIRFLIDRPDARGAFNLAAPGAITNGQLARLLGRMLRRPSFFPVPAFALRLLLGEKATLVLDSVQIAPKRLLDMDYTFKFPEAEPAFRDVLK